jgi:hypothetical protein
MREVLIAIHRHYAVDRKLLLRIAPPVAADQAAALAVAPYRNLSGGSGWASAKIDLTADLETIRGNLDSKWRNSLKKAERSDLKLEVGSDEQTVGRFCGDYAKFLEERKIQTSVSPQLLSKLAVFSTPPWRPLIFSATKEGRNVGDVYIARYGSTGEYLAGIGNDEGRTLNTGNYLLWAAVCHLKNAGCLSLDLGGMDPVLTPKGIYSFKSGMSGQPYQHMGILEAGADSVANKMIRKFLPN